jgi:NAD(P)-dependent dehydrogenase (short-subunit alcohol dehydrogenase family)
MPSVLGKNFVIYLPLEKLLTRINRFVDTPIIKEQIESGSMDAQFQMTPIGRPAKVEEISDVMMFLASSMSSYMCGAALVVDGGFTV